MTRNHLRQALRHLHQILRPAGVDERTDDQLLARFLAVGDQSAFAALVHRHGPMVLGLCHRVLRHTQDAEDAFQAAFLVLARKAASVVHRQALGSWLYRVAYRIAVNAKAHNDKRRVREKQVDELPHPQVLPAEPRDWPSWLDHELNLLPERYRAVLVACDLEERSRKEAARLLGLAEGTVSSRLARGRSLLAKRLARYGLSLSVGTLAAALSTEAPAALALSLTSATLLAATGGGVISASAGFLTKGALKAMFLTKLKWTVGVVMVAVALGATGLAYRVSGQSAPQSAPAPAEKEVRDKPPTELEILRREIELLKLKLEVVQEKQRAQEAELRALRAATREPAKAGRGEKGEAHAAQPRVAAEKALIDQFERQRRILPVIGLLQDVGNLKWPSPLQHNNFSGPRDNINRLMKDAYNSMASGNYHKVGTIQDLEVWYARLKETLDSNVDRLTPDEYAEANRYLSGLKHTIAALKEPNIIDLLNGSRKPKAVPSGRQPAGDPKPKDQPETDMKNKYDMLRSDLFMWKERAAWSERMSQPGRQSVTPAQAEADQARLRSAQLALRQLETQLHLQEADTALKALREARDPKAKQRAADELEKASKQLRELMDKD